MVLDSFLPAACAVVVVLGLQCYSTISVIRRLRRYDRQLQATMPSATDFSDGSGPAGDSMNAIVATVAETPDSSEGQVITDGESGQFEWLQWLNRRIATARRRGEPVTRESAVAELDQFLADDREYVLLQRIGITAPLVGVLVTALAFFTFRVPEQMPAAPASTSQASVGAEISSANAVRRAATGEAILGTIRPLATGVFVGAMLAIINQALLFWIGMTATQFRCRARTWLDRRQELRGDLIDAATAGALMSKSYEAVSRIHSTANQHQDFAQGLQGTIRQLSAATAGIKQGAELMQSEIGDLQAVFRQWRDVATDLNETMQIVGPRTQSAATGLDRLVERLAIAVEQRLVPAIEQQAQFSSVFSDLLRNVDQCSFKLQSVAETVVDSRRLSEETFDTFRASWDAHVVPAQKGFQLGAEQLQAASTSLASRIDGFASTVEGITNRLGDLESDLALPVSALTTAAEAIQSAVKDHLVAAMQTQGQASEKWRQAAGDIGSSAELWKEGIAKALAATQLHEQSTRTLDRVVQEGVLPTWEKVEKAALQLQTAAIELSENVTLSGSVLRESAATIEGVPEMTRQSLGQLRESITEFSSSVRGDFSNATRNYADLVVSLQQSMLSALEVSQRMSKQAVEYDELLQTHRATIAATTETQHAVKKAALDLNEGTRSLTDSIQQQLVPFHAHLAESAVQFQTSAAQLTTILSNSIQPAAAELAGFRTLCEQLHVTLASLQPLADLRAPLGNLRTVVGQLAQTITLINELPEKLENRAKVNSRNGWLRGWFRRRKSDG